MVINEDISKQTGDGGDATKQVGEPKCCKKGNGLGYRANAKQGRRLLTLSNREINSGSVESKGDEERQRDHTFVWHFLWTEYNGGQLKIGVFILVYAEVMEKL